MVQEFWLRLELGECLDSEPGTPRHFSRKHGIRDIRCPMSTAARKSRACELGECIKNRSPWIARTLSNMVSVWTGREFSTRDRPVGQGSNLQCARRCVTRQACREIVRRASRPWFFRFSKSSHRKKKWLAGQQRFLAHARKDPLFPENCRKPRQRHQCLHRRQDCPGPISRLPHRLTRLKRRHWS